MQLQLFYLKSFGD